MENQNFLQNIIPLFCQFQQIVEFYNNQSQEVKKDFSNINKFLKINKMSNKITPYLQEVVYIVADFLQSIEHNKEAAKLKKQFQIPEWVKKDNPLIKKGLKKILKEYINQKEKVLKFFQNRKPEEEEEQVQSQQEEIQQKPVKKNKKAVSPKMSPLVKPKSPKVQTKKAPQPVQPKGWLASQFQQPKRLQDLNDDNQVMQKQQQPQVVIPKQKKQKLSKKVTKKQTSSEQQSSESQESTPKQKKHKKEIKKQKKQKKVKGPVDTSYLNSDDDFQLQDKKKKKSVTPQKVDSKKTQTAKNSSSVVTRKRSAQIEDEVAQQKVKKAQSIVKNHTPKPVVQNRVQNDDEEQQNGDGFPKQFFSRINKNQVGFIPQNRRDNTFEAKQRYGAGDAWGQYGHQKLKDTRGDSFKKTKGKLKNKAFQGSGINMNQINSVPIL